MVSVRMFLEFVKNKDVERITFAIKETRFDIDANDEVSVDSI